MAWLNGGDWVGLSVSQLGEIVAEVLTAINERETAIGKTQQMWYDPHGDATLTEPEATDFAGATRLGAASDTHMRWLCTNLATAHAVLDAIVPRYVSSSAGGWVDWAMSAANQTLYTSIAQVLAEGSYGDEWIVMQYPTDIRPWIQVREVLDLLRWPKISPAIDHVGYYERYGEGLDIPPAWTDDSSEAAWTAALSASSNYTASPTGATYVGYSVQYRFWVSDDGLNTYPLNYDVTLRDAVIVSARLAGYAGTVLDGKIALAKYWDLENIGLAITVTTDAGGEWTIDAEDDLPDVQSLGTDWPDALGSNAQLVYSITSSPPASNPWSDMDPYLSGLAWIYPRESAGDGLIVVYAELEIGTHLTYG